MGLSSNILNRIHIYDLVAYIMPGVMFVFFMFIGFKLLGYNILNISINVIIDSVFYIFIFYVIGLQIHELSNLQQKYELTKLWGGLPSSKFLSKDTDIINQADKKTCCKIANTHFDLCLDADFEDEDDIENKFSKHSHKLYEKFREALRIHCISHDDENQFEIYNNHYGIARNLLALSLLFILYFSILGIILAYQQNIMYIICILLMFVFYVASKLFYKRVLRFANYHVNNIVTSYIILFGNNNKAPQLRISRT